VSERSGVGVVELAILDALDTLRGRPGRRFCGCEQVLAVVEDTSAVPRGYGYEVLVDTACGWLMQVPLIEPQGNFGSQGNDPPASPRYTEARLTLAGQLALAAERGEVAPVPIGLINGNTHRGGLRPPFRPQGIIDAIRLVHRKPRVASGELLDTIGPPDFLTGCTVTGDMSALHAGELTELRLDSRITLTDRASLPQRARPGRRPDAPALHRAVLLIDRFPPYSNPDETVQSLAARSERRSWDNNYPQLRDATRLQLRDVRDLSTDRYGFQIACLPPPDADPDQVRDQVRDIYGVWVGVTIRLRRPLATTIRQWVARNQDEDILASLTALEQAIAAGQPRSGR